MFLVVGVGYGAQQASPNTEARPDPTATTEVSLQAAATLTLPSTPTVVVAPTETPPPVRPDCDQVNATGFLSWDEREWFYANCTQPAVEPTPVPDVVVQSEVLAAITQAPPTPTPQPPPPPPSPPLVVPIGEIEEMVCSYAWNCAWALAVMYCESSGNPNAYNPAGPYIGLFQLHESLGSDLFNPATNIATAYSLYLSHGPSAWGGCA